MKHTTDMTRVYTTHTHTHKLLHKVFKKAQVNYISYNVSVCGCEPAVDTLTIYTLYIALQEPLKIRTSAKNNHFHRLLGLN